MDSTKRFSHRVENYLKYRPRYPAAIIGFLRAEVGLTSTDTIADIGSGTGFLAKHFVENGNPVIGVEPNAEMRAAGDELLSEFANFRSVNGTAEATTLPDASVDYITAGQAFHWFDVEKTRPEFARILKPDGKVLLIWNFRQRAVPFMRDYDAVLHQFADDYGKVMAYNADAAVIDRFFGHGGVRSQSFDYAQAFDFTGLQGRALSSSYSPAPDHPQHTKFIDELQRLFAAYQEDGKVKMLYTTTVYWGCVPHLRG